MFASKATRLRLVACRLTPAALIWGLIGCGGDWSILRVAPTDPAKPILSPAQISVVRQTFPSFQPELFGPGANPLDLRSFLPNNFSPARFFGPALAQGWKPTPSGILVESNGYHGYAAPLPSTGTYFTREGQPYAVQLAAFQRSALNALQSYMGLPQTADPRPIQIDLQAGRVDLLELENELLAIRSSLSQAIPAIANVDPRRCRVVVEPSIFYVTGSTAGNVWASGATLPLDGGGFEIHLAVFYIKGSGEIVNWQDVLVDEALNFYVASVGRPDLMH